MHKLFIVVLVSTITFAQSITYELKPGDTNVKVTATDWQGKNVVLDSIKCEPPPFVQKGNTMVPLSFIKKVFKSEAKWQENTKSVKLINELTPFEIFFEGYGIKDNFKEKLITELIPKAQHSICIEMYSFTNQEIINMIIEKHNNDLKDNKQDVTIQIILNDSQGDGVQGNENTNEVAFNKLKKADIDVRWDWVKKTYDKNKKCYHNLMHRKFCVIDAQHVALGSSNWSDSGLMFNAEVNIIINSKEIGKLFQDQFGKDWVIALETPTKPCNEKEHNNP